MTDKPIIQKIVLAGVVFNDDEKILILQRNANETVFPNLWELPSGKREPLEPSHKSLKREIKEEAGIDVQILNAISVFDYQIEKDTETRDSTQINFIVKTENPTVTLSEEHQNYAWISNEEIENYEISEKTKDVIKLAFNIYPKLAK